MAKSTGNDYSAFRSQQRQLQPECHLWRLSNSEMYGAQCFFFLRKKSVCEGYLSKPDGVSPNPRPNIMYDVGINASVGGTGVAEVLSETGMSSNICTIYYAYS